jgi:Methyltransferase domain
MAKSLYRVKRYSHPKYKFLVRGKVAGRWKRRYFIIEDEAIAFAQKANARAGEAIKAAQKSEEPALARRSPLAAASHDLSSLTLPAYLGPRIQRYIGDSWCMHLPFAYDLMREVAPKVFVELGVKEGESYFTFCQSAAENQISVRCYGIDSWRGDIQTGKLDPRIRDDVEKYNWQYSSFSELKQMLFAEALNDFADASIDLLHIDGAHTYGDVKTDFESWLPKLSPNGLVLFHDVMVRDRGFGVWKVWEEIARKDNSFLFQFGFGLGVWKKQSFAPNDPPFLQTLFRANAVERRAINESYANAAAALALWHTLAEHFAPRNQPSFFTIEPKERATEIARLRHAAEIQATQLARAQRELEEKARQLTNPQSELKETTSQLAQIRRDADVQSQQMEQLRRDLEEKARLASNLERDLEEKAHQASNLERDLEEKAHQASNLERDLEEKAHQASNLERDLHNALQETTGLQQGNADLRRERDKYAQSIELVKSQLQASEERLAQASLDVLDAQWETLKLRGNSARHSESDLADARIIELESRVAAAQSERDHLRAMVSALQKDLDFERSRLEMPIMEPAEAQSS